MILTALLFGAAVIAGAGIVAAFWNDLVAFLKKAVEKVRALVAGIVYGTKVFIRKIGEAFKEISRNYSKVDDHWQETIVTREIPASKVPEDIWPGPTTWAMARSWISRMSWKCSWKARKEAQLWKGKQTTA